MRLFEVVLRIRTRHGEKIAYINVRAINRGRAVLLAKHIKGGSLIHVRESERQGAF
jgi:hypothetical protein